MVKGFIAIGLCACVWLGSCQRVQPDGPAEAGFARAQALVDRTVKRHPEIVRLTIHAVPAWQEHSRIVASNVREKVGQASDPEDVEAMRTGKVTVLQEGENLDVTAPILDASGKAIAATGITLPCPAIAGKPARDAVEAKARAIAEELTLAIRMAETPMW